MAFLPEASVVQFNTKETVIMSDPLMSVLRLRALRERVEVHMNLTEKGVLRNKFVRYVALLDQRIATMAGVLSGVDKPT
jgi:hypothetical protein